MLASLTTFLGTAPRIDNEYVYSPEGRNTTNDNVFEVGHKNLGCANWIIWYPDIRIKCEIYINFALDGKRF